MDNSGWVYCGDGKNMPEEEGWYICTLQGGDHSYLCISNYEIGCLGGWQYENVIAYYPKTFSPYIPKQNTVVKHYE
ncbi:MAG: hypothetical protein NC541_11210 [bacterium]|nr:hypothetical protein [bacterium]